MGTPELLYIVEEGALGPLLIAFQADFPAIRTEPLVENATYLDTVDRRILAAGGMFETLPGYTGVELHWRHGTTSLRARASDRPQFARNLPAGPLRQGLTELIGARRLVPLVEVERRVQELDLRDDEDKKTARLRIVQRRVRAPELDAEWRTLPTVVQARSVRGYFHAFADLTGWLGARPEFVPHETSELEEALELIGQLQPAEEHATVHFPDQPAFEAARGALRAELETWISQSEGVRADTDPEFLHQGRVALRRARSVLRQLRGVLPPAASGDLVEELRWLARESGPQRDLDVFLGELEDLLRSLPPQVNPPLQELAAYTREEREAARLALVAVLDGTRHRTILATWRGLVDGSDPRFGAEEVPGAGDPVLPVLAKRIRKRHARLLDAGQRASQDPTPVSLHELRLECKKLRYLIDSFRGVFPANRLASLLEALRALQDVLGRSNDSQRQSLLLQDVAQRAHAAGRASAGCLMAAGRLLEVLDERGERAAREALELFRSFAGRQELVEALLPAEGPR